MSNQFTSLYKVFLADVALVGFFLKMHVVGVTSGFCGGGKFFRAIYKAKAGLVKIWPENANLLQNLEFLCIFI